MIKLQSYFLVSCDYGKGIQCHILVSIVKNDTVLCLPFLLGFKCQIMAFFKTKFYKAVFGVFLMHVLLCIESYSVNLKLVKLMNIIQVVVMRYYIKPLWNWIVLVESHFTY